MADFCITFDDNYHFDITRTIEHIAKTNTEGLVDTYTIYYEDGTTSNYYITNGAKGDKGDTGDKGDRGEQGIQGIQGETGNGISSIAKKSTVGLVDTYTITFTDGTTYDFEIHNGTASIDKTLSIADRAAEARATGYKIDYNLDRLMENNYRTCYPAWDFVWENGSIGSSGAPNSNAYSTRTADYIEFDEDNIVFYDPDDPAYRLVIVYYDKTTGAYVGQQSKNDITSEYSYKVNHDYKYRLVLYNTAQTTRAVSDGLKIYDADIKRPVFIKQLEDDIDYAGKSSQGGNYRTRHLGKRIAWNNGGLNGSGQPTGDVNALFSEFVEFGETAIIAVDPAGATYRLSCLAYNKETGAYIETVYKNYINLPTKIVGINPAYKYRLCLYNIAQSGRPTGQTLEIYEYADTIEKRKKDVKQEQRCHFKQRRPLISIIDDDGSVEFYNRYFDANGNYLVNYPMCTAYEGESLGRADFMSKDQLKSLVDAGCEILGHGSTPLAPERGASDPITIEEAEADIITNLRPLLDAGFDVGGYCYPYGSCNVEVREMIAKYYTHAYAGLRSMPPGQSAKWYNDGCIPTYAIARYPLYDGNNQLKSWAALQPVIDATVAHNGWLVLYTHTWRDTTGTATAEALNALFAQIEDAGAEIVKASEAYEVFKNALQAGDYLGLWNECSDWTSIDAYETHTADDAGSAINQLGEADIRG